MPRPRVTPLNADEIEIILPDWNSISLESTIRSNINIMSRANQARETTRPSDTISIPANIRQIDAVTNLANIQTAIRENKPIELYGSTIRRRNMYPVKSVVVNENDNTLMHIVGAVNGTLTIIHDNIVSVTLIDRENLGETRTSRDRDARISRLYDMAVAVKSEGTIASISDGNENITVQRIISVNRLPHCLEISVTFHGVAEEFIAYLSDSNYIEWADSSDTRRLSRSSATNKLYSIAHREEVTIEPFPSSMMGIDTMEKLFQYAHENRRLIYATKRDRSDVCLTGIGPYDNGFFAGNTYENGCIRYTPEMFVMVSDGGNVGRRSMHPLTSEHTLRTAMEKNLMARVQISGYLADDMQRNIVLEHVTSILPLYAGEGESVILANLIDGKQVAFDSQHIEWAWLDEQRNNTNGITLEEQVACLTETVSIYASRVRELESENAKVHEYERERNLAREVLAAKTMLYGEDSREVAIAKAEYEWLTQAASAACTTT